MQWHEQTGYQEAEKYVDKDLSPLSSLAHAQNNFIGV